MFDKHYSAIVADTDESKAIHFHLRYQVYCLEKRFEPSEYFKAPQEFDEYDDCSVHFLIQHKASGQWVGAARLVLGAPIELPMAKLASTPIQETVPTDTGAAELSRLAILRSFRRHGREAQVSKPEVLLGLIRAAKEYSENHGIDYWLFLCRPSIKRIVGYFGMEMETIGPPCVHRGIRYPFLATLATAFDGVATRSDDVAAFFGRTGTLRYHSMLPLTHHRSRVA